MLCITCILYYIMCIYRNYITSNHHPPLRHISTSLAKLSDTAIALVYYGWYRIALSMLSTTNPQIIKADATTTFLSHQIRIPVDYTISRLKILYKLLNAPICTYTRKLVQENVGFKQLINDVRKATNAPSVFNIKQQRNSVYLYWYIL